MGLQIEDGGGSGNLVRVDDFRLAVTARTNPWFAYVSRDTEDSYTWTHTYDYDANDTILLLSNSSTTKNLHIHFIAIGSDTSTEFALHCPAYPTLAGTAITGININRTSGKAADVECYGDETGNTRANVLIYGMVMANTNSLLPIEGSIILGYHDCIAIDLVTAGAKGNAMIAGYFE
jgi:hypothetical protein